MDPSRFRFALRWAGLSQAAAARAAGLHAQRITDHLSARRRLQPTHIAALAAVLRVEPAWLAGKGLVHPPEPQPSAVTHPVAGMMRPLHANLMLVTWGELLVLWRSLNRSKDQGGQLDGEIATGLLQRLSGATGLDAEALASAAQVVDQVARIG